MIEVLQVSVIASGGIVEIKWDDEITLSISTKSTSKIFKPTRNSHTANAKSSYLFMAMMNWMRGKHLISGKDEEMEMQTILQLLLFPTRER